MSSAASLLLRTLAKLFAPAVGATRAVSAEQMLQRSKVCRTESSVVVSDSHRTHETVLLNNLTAALSIWVEE